MEDSSRPWEGSSLSLWRRRQTHKRGEKPKINQLFMNRQGIMISILCQDLISSLYFLSGTFCKISLTANHAHAVNQTAANKTDVAPTDPHNFRGHFKSHCPSAKHTHRSYVQIPMYVRLATRYAVHLSRRSNGSLE